MSNLERLWAGWRSEFVEASSVPDAKAGCVFCSLLGSGESDTATHVVWRHREGLAVAILNAYPYTSGHLMVMPVRHTGELEDLAEQESRAMWGGIDGAVRALKSAYRPDGINLGANIGKAAGAGVPAHFHVHVLPRWNGDTNFMTAVADARVLPEPLERTDHKLRDAWPTS